MNIAHKQGVFEEKKNEYWIGNKKHKSEILDAVTMVSGLSRKAAIKRFHTLLKHNRYPVEKRGRPVIYTTDCITALKEVWEIGSESCGENLYPMIGEYIAVALRDRSWKHWNDVTAKLLPMSMGSVKRYIGRFVRTRRNFGGESTTQKSSIILMVPIRMDGWNTAEDGVTQIDTVAHCGDTVAGDFVFTTNATDIATLWGIRRAQWNKGQEVTLTSLDAMRSNSLFTWTEMHPDSGSEFINRMLIVYTENEWLHMNRSRTYHKNDNCFIEDARNDVSEEVKDKLRAEHATLNPKTMKADVDRLTSLVFAVQRQYGTPRKLLETA